MPQVKEKLALDTFATVRIGDGLLKEGGKALFALAAGVSRKDAIFVEVGSWIGHTASIFGTLAQECNGHVFCIDHWKGSPDVKEQQVGEDCFNLFRKYMEVLGFNDVVHPLVMESARAATIFSDAVADLVFIDADHRYNSVKQDIDLWWPKVKVGGILCGHDCEEYYSNLTPRIRKLIDKNLDKDFGDNMHCGVIRAVNDCFGRNFSIIEGTTIWYKRKVE